MKTAGNNNAQKSFVFNIDVLIEGETNAIALERLLHLLNNEAIPDFRIRSGLQIGRLIEEALLEPALKPVNIPQQLQAKAQPKATAKSGSDAEAKRGAKPEAQAEPKTAEAKPDFTAAKAPGNKPPTADKTGATGKAGTLSDEADATAERIRSYIAANKLIRLNVNKGRGVKLSVPCRILSYDESKLAVTVYHVDEKQVYIFDLNEIDDFI
ncbi:hypothetical protein BG53_08755 [Paenibacillus darwinianus]|uniref:Uncharacterized protein n=1 Tax=Paenibacillus darwinianus TaxID=1380763 RepID=A0A9W5S3U9_9BACL|nr:hypothetical protein [Paenibacillus darwinianus]EXX91679.1 hypothetical protein CH50_13215 [Paenibacillus darwinianus]EXX91824.1 hypothetical protein BG53_08755 [Paenibacillus darwinianus]EXX92475.1 hypothetical protein BG52_12545 [Paenibacillus darwinianus]